MERRCPPGMRAHSFHQDEGATLVQLERDSPAARPRTARLPRSPSGAVSLLSGALYNASDLTAALNLDPTLSPALLADAVIDRWGVEGLARLNGDYALVRWSPDNCRLQLAACPMGHVSLCYALTADGILVASAPSWLLAFPEVDTTPDTDALALRLVKMQSRIGDRTAWRSIRRLQPGQVLEWRDGAISISSFWSPVPKQTLHLRRDEDYLAAAREHLDRAVSARCPQGEPVLCLLSAGLDSTGVAATAARLHDGPIHALTVRADPTVPLLEPDARHFRDEWDRLGPFFQQYPNLIPHVADATLPEMALETPGSLLQSRDWPFKSPHQVAWIMQPLQRTVGNVGTPTVLTGEMGNVTLSYTGSHVVADHLKAGRWIAACRDLIPYRKGWSGYLRSLWNQGLMPLVPPIARKLMRRLQGRRDYWWQDWSSIRPDVAGRMALEEHDLPVILTGSPDLDRHIRLLDHHRLNTSHYAQFLQNQGWSMRDPYSDIRLVEFCLSLPRGQFRRGGIDRLLARRVLADRVPQPILTERRIGLQHADWYGWMSQRRDWMASEIDRIERSSLACSILDTRQMRAILDSWPATPEEAGRFPTSHRLRKGLGEALRIGQFILMQEGRND